MSALSILLIAGVLSILALASLVYFVLEADESPFYRFLGRYEERLDNHTRFLLSPYSGSQIARLQVISVIVLLAIALVFKSFVFVLLAVVAAILPQSVLRRRHEERVAKIESLLDTWLLMLANALKATPSIGEAIASTINLVPKPINEEIDLVVKENRLGTSVDEAIRNMDGRIRSPVVSGALAMILVGRETGGDLPHILETSAEALRESARLDGVLRTKTADSRGQLVVLAVIPFALCGLIAWTDPEWFSPILTTRLGHTILLCSIIIWGAALFWASKIVDVDL